MNSVSYSGQKLGKYRIGCLLGAGTMGEVYEASDGQEALAVKLIQGQLAQDEQYVQRFLREVKLMQMVRHPNIIPIRDFGFQDRCLYLVMPLIEGTTLRQIMKAERFSPRAVWTIFDPLTQALAHAHLQGIIHRDVKPGNVLIASADQRVYLSDFGLSKRPGLDTRITETGVSIGTPYYMPPEAVVGEEWDERSDIYSLGVILYEMLLNKRPFDLPDSQLTMYAHVYQPVPIPSDEYPNFPAILDLVILTCLAKDRRERYLTIREFAQAYTDALDSLSDAEANFVYGDPA